MKLTQELLSITPKSQVDEQVKNPVGYKSFVMNVDRIEDMIEKFRPHIANDGHWSKLGTELGGDDSFRKDALAALDKLEDAVLDWHMSVGTAQDSEDFVPQDGDK